MFGATTSPQQEEFKNLGLLWPELNKSDYSPIKLHRNQRGLKSLVIDTTDFLHNWIVNSSNSKLRHDYLELAQLALISLGGNLPFGGTFSFKAPGAYHQARWMAKVIYTIKMALLNEQLMRKDFEPEHLENIRSLALFLCVFYVKAWLTCTSAADAPANDLLLLKSLSKTKQNVSQNPKNWPKHFLSFVTLASEKLQNHPWYLSERLVPAALFSDHVSSFDKKGIKKAMLKCKDKIASQKQLMPFLDDFTEKSICDFVGPDTWTFFNLLQMDAGFLRLPVTQWSTSLIFSQAKLTVENLPVVNDAAERALGLATNFNTKTAPKSESSQQALYKVVEAAREKLGSLATSSELITKKALAPSDYSRG